MCMISIDPLRLGNCSTDAGLSLGYVGDFRAVYAVSCYFISLYAYYRGFLVRCLVILKDSY